MWAPLKGGGGCVFGKGLIFKTDRNLGKESSGSWSLLTNQWKSKIENTARQDETFHKRCFIILWFVYAWSFTAWEIPVWLLCWGNFTLVFWKWNSVYQFCQNIFAERPTRKNIIKFQEDPRITTYCSKENRQGFHQRSSCISNAPPTIFLLTSLPWDFFVSNEAAHRVGVQIRLPLLSFLQFTLRGQLYARLITETLHL